LLARERTNFEQADNGKQLPTQVLQLDTAEQSAEQFQALIISSCSRNLGKPRVDRQAMNFSRENLWADRRAVNFSPVAQKSRQF
jgi:hypothetical protein